jgi:M-phase inducer tyrosine phosphatase
MPITSFEMASQDVPVPDLLLTFPDARQPRSFGRAMSQGFQTKSTNEPSMIDSAGLRDLMANYRQYGFGSLIIMDARFEYEFNGGHIKTSWNVWGIAEMRKLYAEFRDCHACVVFHCEFSKDRGPYLMGLFREYDRTMHAYPDVSYPDVFLLEGGYKKFYLDCPDLCTGGYVPMRTLEFVKNGILKGCHAQYLVQSGRGKWSQWRLSSGSPVVGHNSKCPASAGILPVKFSLESTDL